MKFWVLDEHDRYTRANTGSCYYDIEEPYNLGDFAGLCPGCGRPSGPRVWIPPYNVCLSQADCGDLVLGVAFELVASKKFKDVYANSRLSGLSEFRRIEKLTVSGHPEYPAQGHVYYVTRPTITFTLLDEVESGVKWKKSPTCNHCRLGVRSEIKKVVVNEDTWDGSDIFMATGFYGSKLVTERFVEAVQKGALINFVFIPAEQYSEKA